MKSREGREEEGLKAVLMLHVMCIAHVQLHPSGLDQLLLLLAFLHGALAGSALLLLPLPTCSAAAAAADDRPVALGGANNLRVARARLQWVDGGEGAVARLARRVDEGRGFLLAAAAAVGSSTQSTPLVHPRTAWRGASPCAAPRRGRRRWHSRRGARSSTPARRA